MHNSGESDTISEKYLQFDTPWLKCVLPAAMLSLLTRGNAIELMMPRRCADSGSSGCSAIRELWHEINWARVGRPRPKVITTDCL